MPLMATRREEPSAVELLEERITTLEFLKDFHREILAMIRRYTGDESYTSEECLREISALIHQKLELYMVNIMLVEELSGELVLYVCKGDDRDIDPHVKQYRVKLGQGLTGKCGQSGETIVANDTRKHPDFVPGPLPKTRSECCLPLKVGSRVIGVLDIQSTALNRFRRDIVDLMEEISVSISFVLENKRLYDDLKRRSDNLEHKVAEQVTEISEREDRFRLMIENSSEPILMLDTGGRVTYANANARALTGLEADRLEGLHITKLIQKGSIHKLVGVFRQVQEHKKPRPVQVEMVNQGGDVRTVEVAALPLSERGRVTGIQMTLRDITERLTIDKLKKNYLKSLEEEVSARIAEIKDTQRAAIFAIATLAESIDEDTGGHLERIRHYSKALAGELRKLPRYADLITEEYAELLFDLSPLHDLGKVGIRDYILLKTGKLTKEEYETMQQHTEIGARALRMAGQMINRESIFTIGEMIAHYHHEKWDGSGYPAVDVDGERRPLRGEEIPLCARIVALADVYDALTSKRPYKQALPHDWAKKKIVSDAGKHFDPEVVAAFLSIEEQFLDIKKQFPDSMPTLGAAFELPERDREEMEAAARKSETASS